MPFTEQSVENLRRADRCSRSQIRQSLAASLARHGREAVEICADLIAFGDAGSFALFLAYAGSSVSYEA